MGERGTEVYPASLQMEELQEPGMAATTLYEGLSLRYPRFFKMDAPSRWAWLASEWLFKDPGSPLEGDLSRERVGVVMATRSGSLEVDQRFYDSMETVASPALFVYTLSNIMMGEICIRYGFKGEQLCLVEDQPPASLLQFYGEDLLLRRGMDACLMGWVEAFGDKKKIGLFWVSRQPSRKVFDEESIVELTSFL